MRKAMWIIIILAGLYVLMGLYFYFNQEEFIFHPNTESSPDVADLPIKDYYIATPDGVVIHSWWMPLDSAKKTILYFHGNAGSVPGGEKRMRFFREMGYNVFAAEYREFGRSKGKIKKEEDLYVDAQTAYDFLIQKLHVKPNEIVIWGWSLGGAVSTELASKNPCHSLVLEGTFCSIQEMAKKLFWFYPFKWLSRYSMPTIDKINKIQCPVLFAHSKDDKTIPINQGKQLFETYNGKKMFIEIHGDHNHAFLDSQDELIKKANQFLNSIDSM